MRGEYIYPVRRKETLPVLAGIQVLKLKALLERVVILHTVDQIIVQVEKGETVGHESVVEPMESVGGEVEVH